MLFSPDVRPSSIAGKWYPANPDKLASSVDHYINQAVLPMLKGKVVAVIAPHAGHLYSGPVAGWAFAALRGLKPDLVALVAPMHYPYQEPLLSSAHTAYRTPLGEIAIDRQALLELDGQLQKRLGFGLTSVREDPEHSLEIELPFLQRVLLNEFMLLPVMVRDQRPIVAQALGESLAAVLKDRRALLVASTDLSHFYPQDTAEILDGRILRLIEAFDPAGILEAEEEGRGFACGKGALAAVLLAARELGAERAQILHYATSGDVSGDYDQVVGYASAICTRTAG
jgi:MEMO1 family protein